MKHLKEAGVNTIYETQGKTFRKTIIVRLQSNSEVLFESVSHILVGLTKHTERCYYYTVRNDEMSRRIKRTELTQTLVETNDVVANAHIPMKRTIHEVKSDPSFELPTCDAPNLTDTVQVIQDFYNRVMPDASTEVNDYNDYEVEYGPMTLHLSDIRTMLTKGNPARPVDGMCGEGIYVSKLHTGQQQNRPATQTQTLLTLQKRNCDAPKTGAPLDFEAETIEIKDKFVDYFCVPYARKFIQSFQENPIILRYADIADWVEVQDAPKLNCIENPERAVTFHELSEFAMIMKKALKNQLDPDGCYKYACLQSVVHYATRVNALMSPVFPN